ncbi:MAG: VanZ family protein [Phycisphaerales bacterium]|nr:VanZ family protein [Phycisphaerales bacterium]MCB9835240.1 VanZ family protein [Phycisphaera sp.]
MPDEPRARTHAGDARVALALLAIVVVFVTLYPFGFVRTGGVYLHDLKQALRDPFDLYLPVHALPAMLGVWLLSACRRWKRRWMPAAVVCAALIALEFVQAGVAHRHARVGDLGVQWVGAGLGVWLIPVACRAGAVLGRARRAIWTLLLVVWTALACAAVVRGQMGHRIEVWDESFPFMLGDEYEGQRNWSGVIHTAAVYAHAIDQSRAQTLSDTSLAQDGGIGARQSLAPSLIYDLAQGPECLGSIDFDLRTKDIVYSERGLELDEGRYAQGQRPASEITQAIVEAGGATIEVECTPTLTEQFGPARIVTISKGLDYRNITLGQEGDAAVLRVRTRRAGPNGADIQIEWPGVFEAGKRVHLIVTTTGGRSRLWVDGVDMGERESISKLGDWLKIRSAGKSWIAGVVLYLPIGLIATALARGPMGRGVIAGVFGGVAIAAALGYAQTAGRTLPMNAAAVGGVCVAVGLVLGWWMNRAENRTITAELRPDPES